VEKLIGILTKKLKAKPSEGILILNGRGEVMKLFLLYLGRRRRDKNAKIVKW